MEVFVLVSYLEVLKHFQAHNLKWPILRKTHLYNNLFVVAPLWSKTMYGQTNAWVMLGCCLMVCTMHSHCLLELIGHDLIGLLPHGYVQGH
jgi:hypothetical protein